MAHNHDHAHESALGRRALKITLGIVLVIMVVEIVGGLLSNSLALLGDAGHMLVDALALGLSLFALTIAQRPATASKTYGFHRVEIMAALANGTTLILVATFIFYESYQRFLNPPQIRPPLMLAVAFVGLISNLAGIFLLRRAGQGLNIKAAFWHVVGDTISSVGVIAAGFIIMFTGWSFADPIIAIVIGGIILFGAVQIMRESIDILLEAAPKHIATEKVIQNIKEIEGIQDVHDIHIWTITSGMFALSAHLVVKDTMVSHSTEIMEKTNKVLAKDFNITHTTLQVECDSCPSGNICVLNPGDNSSTGSITTSK